MGKPVRDTAADLQMIGAISRNSVPALIELIDRTSTAARATLSVLPFSTEWRYGVLAATYLEVWWLAGCRHRLESDVSAWVAEIVERRIEEARAHRPGASSGPTAAEIELAALLRCTIESLPFR